MLQVRDGARLAAKLLLRPWLDLHMQDFDSSQSLQVELFCQIYLSKSPLSEQTEQAVMAELLSDPISHIRVSFRAAKTRVLKGDAFSGAFANSWGTVGADYAV
jgi:hypothetical protein